MYIGRNPNRRRYVIVIGGGGGSANTTTEPLSGEADGINTRFTTTYNFIPESLLLFLNGVYLNVSDNYEILNDNTVSMIFPVLPGDKLEANYAIK